MTERRRGGKILDFCHTYNTNGIDEEQFINSTAHDAVINSNA